VRGGPLRIARRFLTRPLRPAVVIPVHNDAEGLARLLARIRAMGCFSQIVVVDDGSDIPVPAAPDLRLRRHPQSRGGGVARNTGLAAVRARHVMFLDADDLPTRALADLLADLGGAGRGRAAFDFCLFKHADSRVSAEGLWGQPDWDERFWQEAGLSVGALRAAPRAAWPLLAQTANYPWNKVYRTDFLRRNRIGCAETEVHQDIPLHWLGFLAARRILVSDRVGVWHGVSAAGDRLTNRAGPERLQMFAALDPVAEAVAQSGDPAWQAALAGFVLGLADWGAARIDRALRADLRAAERGWLDRVTGGWQGAIAERDADLAARLRARIAGRDLDEGGGDRA